VSGIRRRAALSNARHTESDEAVENLDAPSDLIVARRETTNTRAEHLDAKIALARARIALDSAAGVVP
jgi:hypothetical protein